MQIRFITIGTKEYDDMIALRMSVLLDPINIPRSFIDPQKEKEDTLVGAFENDRLIGCCILTGIDAATIQLRQMAVNTTVQKKGVGAAIVAFAEATARRKGYTTLLMHARDTVTGFYQQCGYQISGDKFFEVGIGHFKMEKKLV